MEIDQKQIIKISELAKLKLSEEEKSEFSKQLSDIISYVDKVNEMNTENIEPTDHIIDLKNVLREDCIKDSLDISEIDRISPEFEEGHIVVPRIIEE